MCRLANNRGVRSLFLIFTFHYYDVEILLDILGEGRYFWHTQIDFISPPDKGSRPDTDCYEVDVHRPKGKQSLSPLQPFSQLLTEFPSPHSTARSLWIRSRFLRLLIIASLLCLSLFDLGCEKHQDSLIDTAGSPPVLLHTSISPSSINSDSINVGTSRSPDDVLSISAVLTADATGTIDNPVTAVRYVLNSPNDNQSISNGQLFDDGVGTEVINGDGKYSAKVTFQIKRVEIGVFSFSILAESKNGFQSNANIVPLTVYRGNNAPVLSDLDTPDTVKLGSQNQLLVLHVRANDPDGLSDIASVVFNSFKPDDTPSGGNPFRMYDDGNVSNHGDDKAGDGVYSLIVTLPPTVQTGTYRFEFQAFDRSNAASNILIQRITVKP